MDIPQGATCRICRGEATEESPLFHPCRCRGSIKYIHESCLLEWISSKNIDISKTGAEVNCDICHHPFNFKTTYVEDMPEKIPFPILLKSTLKATFSKMRKSLEISLALVLFLFGWPLVWNTWARLYTFALDGTIPYEEDTIRSILFGFQENPEYYRNIVLTKSTVLKQLLWNYKFTALQIALIVILHIALYFQYDMIVREEVFSKMILHKIGPKLSINDMKARLMERFPMMDEAMIDHLAVALRARENNRQGIQDEAQRPIVVDRVQEREPLHEVNADEEVNPQNNINNMHLDSDDDENDPDFVVNDHDSDTDDEANHWGVGQQDEMNDPFRERFEEMMNRRAQNQFDNLLAQQQERNAQNAMNRPNAPIFIPPVQEAQPDEAMQDNDGANAVLINVKLKLSSILIYFVVGAVVCSLYLLLSYLIPTVVGYGLIRVYLKILEIAFRGFNLLMHYSKLSVVYFGLVKYIPFISVVHQELVVATTHQYLEYYQGYFDNSMKHSMLLRALPCLTTYLTAIAINTVVSEMISKGYGRHNGLSSNVKRQIFQITFAIRCTLKVFTLFFIELAGFPILAGVMLDIALFCPILGSPNKLLSIPQLFRIWPKLSFFAYWIIGTLYMYWFAKYIGMIRKHIIRPGVLFFIRSPEDPNIRILHDSLIHPMGIQLSRLCLSMFIYAVFIIAGFGLHTRVIFPMLWKSGFSTFSDKCKPDSFFDKTSLTILLAFTATRNILEKNSVLKRAVKDYWVYVFHVCARNLRLSSFIIGKDVPTERGHILYRNWFFKLFASQKAQWSNTELFTSPKTYDEALELFRENKSVHAYFIPDGVLMRVPSSDIVSRSYVQTMFVPVTTDDKILKPLDFKKINERNKSTAGEFGYLDEQNTEFDHYFVVYVPPNFRMRYMILIGLIWFFSSLLFISICLMSHYTSKLLMLPIEVFIMTNSNENKEEHINPYYVCIGLIILSQLLPKVYKLVEKRTLNKTHQVETEVEAENEDDENDVEVPMEPEVAFLDIVKDFKESFVFKLILSTLIAMGEFWIALISNIALLVHLIIAYNYCIALCGGSRFISFLPSSSGDLFTSTNDKIRTIFTIINSVLLLLKGKRTGSVFIKNKNRRTSELLKRLLSAVLTNTLKFHGSNLLVLAVLCVIFNVINGTLYLDMTWSSTAKFIPLVFNSVPSHSWSRTEHAYMMTLLLAYFSYFISNFMVTFSKYWNVLEQGVKDTIYTKGKKLENLPEEKDGQ
ncbi:ERAD-associated E3 ubiquitin-protein ligase DOA10 [Nakaseomyces glabratus]|uniref:RING-type E3 ubiquitin transferase n=1 Tax=Candida glabrata TaxID=5478 RepID=A0A0W0DNR8_CANGB|nr:RING-variant domain [Nakaseomyces glabratus]KAH7597652.1 RING-variant domain [Nakaseomyces glabratus]KAH7612397.1 RING-variant domain [Nakaseomyces glabratus]KAJ9568752.1 RING-type E3 ubiquitin transferase [Nakaseomyces glabratus]KTB06000.1 ERAD-associated E3 ubiquitin-protein ligase DOA10 [Nakaseomyces glabratus]